MIKFEVMDKRQGVLLQTAKGHLRALGLEKMVFETKEEREKENKERKRKERKDKKETN